MSKDTISVQFVDAIPENLEELTLYVAMDFATAVHKCCCGCGEEVVTPLSPTDWKLTYDGVSVSLSPSIGNWGSTCQSHYWIAKNTIKWARKWTLERIEAVRAADRRSKQRYYGEGSKPAQSATKPASPRFLSRIWHWFSG